jgi:hypothetical protein
VRLPASIVEAQKLKEGDERLRITNPFREP